VADLRGIGVAIQFDHPDPDRSVHYLTASETSAAESASWSTTSGEPRC
jgi:hypothetical protein